MAAELVNAESGVYVLTTLATLAVPTLTGGVGRGWKEKALTRLGSLT